MTEQTTTLDLADSYTPAHLSARAYGPPVTLGRVVIYTDHGGREFPAVVAGVHSEDVVDLAILAARPMRKADGEMTPAGTVAFAYMIGFDHDRGPGTWRWPERV